MAVKRRAPKGRQFNITPEMVELFRRARAIEESGTDCESEEDGGHRREYLDVSTDLNRAFGLAPWEMSPLDAGPQQQDYAPRLPYTQSWKRARELRLALDRASRDAG